MLALKANQAALFDDVWLYLDDPAHAQTPPALEPVVDGDHDRIETRWAFLCTTIEWLADHRWPGLAAVGKIRRQRELNASTSQETAYLLSAPLSAARFGEVTRAHWGIENSLHWVLDVTMHEDHNRTGKDNAAENLALLRRWAINACKIEGSKGSIKGKIKHAGWNDGFLVRLLAAAGKCQMR